MYFDGRTANYEKEPYLEITQKDAQAFWGFVEIADCLKMKIEQLQKERVIVVIDYYHGVRQKEIEKLIDLIAPDQSIFCETAKIEEEILGQLLHHHITDDRVFGILGMHTMSEFYDKKRQEELQKEIEQFQKGVLIVYGVGASLFAKPDLLVYGDLSRWEIQLRYRSGELDNWGVGNYDEDILRKYKRGYFVEWRMLDRHKVQIFDQIDFLLDTNVKGDPKMINKHLIRSWSSSPNSHFVLYHILTKESGVDDGWKKYANWNEKKIILHGVLTECQKRIPFMQRSEISLSKCQR